MPQNTQPGHFGSDSPAYVFGRKNLDYRGPSSASGDNAQGVQESSGSVTSDFGGVSSRVSETQRQLTDQVNGIADSLNFGEFDDDMKEELEDWARTEWGFDDEQVENMDYHDAYIESSVIYDNLGYNTVIDQRGNYSGSIINLAIGGPYIKLDTQEGKVSGSWGSDHWEADIKDDTLDIIDERMEEIYEALK